MKVLYVQSALGGADLRVSWMKASQGQRSIHLQSQKGKCRVWHCRSLQWVSRKASQLNGGKQKLAKLANNGLYSHRVKKNLLPIEHRPVPRDPSDTALGISRRPGTDLCT